MAATRTPMAIEPDEDRLEEWFRAEGLSPRWWENTPGETFERHRHDFHKVLFCVAGSITFHTDDGDIRLDPGDRLDLDPGTDHAATTGPEGVRCVEAARLE